ncbi:MAG: glycerophosphodiester phosphodiesterase, partial [Rhodobacteraceae bacterium]|nr:glycerophosphodiester phosphodiesterase [Paracoccaceae bacterium]
MMLSRVFHCYKAALGLWAPLVAGHLFIRLVVTAVMLPVIGGLLALTLLFSDQTALTDQDIAWFLLTPAGVIGAVVVLSLLIAAMVLDVVVATAILLSRTGSARSALTLAAGFSLHAVPRLLPFVARLLGRILLIMLPFLAVGGGLYLMLLTEYDINYYLSQTPPVFYWAVGLIGAVVLAMVVALIAREEQQVGVLVADVAHVVGAH